MSRKKSKIIIFGIVLLALLAVVILVYVQKQVSYQKEQISIDFTSGSSELCITINDGYELQWINTSNEYLTVPMVDQAVRSVSMDVSAIPVGKNDILTLAIQKANRSSGDFLACEVLHQSENQFIVEVTRKSDGKVTSYTFDC